MEYKVENIDSVIKYTFWYSENPDKKIIYKVPKRVTTNDKVDVLKELMISAESKLKGSKS